MNQSNVRGHTSIANTCVYTNPEVASVGLSDPHPALAEVIMEACGDAIGRAVHK